LKNAEFDSDFESFEKLQEVSAKIIRKKGPHLLVFNLLVQRQIQR
jgi:hypothetical protein